MRVFVCVGVQTIFREVNELFERVIEANAQPFLCELGKKKSVTGMNFPPIWPVPVIHSRIRLCYKRIFVMRIPFNVGHEWEKVQFPTEFFHL